MAISPNRPDRKATNPATMAAPIDSLQAFWNPSSVSATCPPSRGRMGSRLNSAHQMLTNASRSRMGHQLNPPLNTQSTSRSSPQSLSTAMRAGTPSTSSWVSAPDTLTMTDLGLVSTRRPPPVGTVNPPKPWSTMAERCPSTR